MWRKQLAMLSVALTDFSRNNCHYVASGIAYWSLFSLIPLALAGIAPRSKTTARREPFHSLAAGTFSACRKCCSSQWIFNGFRGAGIAGATALGRVPPIKYDSVKNLDQSFKRTRS